MAVDLSVFGRQKSLLDQQDLQKAFELKKALALQQRQAQTPAALQIADAFAQARASGDVQRMNDIALAAKSFDKGLIQNPDGSIGDMSGYAQAVGGIAAAKAGMSQQAKKNVDLYMNPQIKSGEQTAKNAADQNALIVKKGVNANDALGVISEIEPILNSGNPSGSRFGAAVNAGKRLYGGSDASTQANAQLELLGGRLVSTIPRMEGPQSDADVKMYREQAAKVSDPTVPAKDKLAALGQLKKLNQKYSTQAGIPSTSMDELNSFPQGSAMPPALPLQGLDKKSGLSAEEKAELDALRKRFKR